MGRLIVGDAVSVLKKRIEDESINLTVTSPPYGDLREYYGFRLDIPALIEELYRVTVNGGVVVWVVGDTTKNGTETGESFRQALSFLDAGFNLHDTMIYEKSNCAFPSSNRYYQIFEYMFVFSKGKPTVFNPIKDRKNIYVGQKAHGKSRTRNGWTNNSSRTVTQEYGVRYNVWRYVTGGGNSTKDKIAYEHPAIFPEKLAEDHIKTWSNEGDVILDPMCGSGTVCKASKKLGRQYIGIDVSRRYIEITKERLKLV